MDKFQQKEMKKIKPIKNAWYDLLINYIRDPIRKLAKQHKQTVYGRGKKIRKPKAQNKVNSIRNSFIL